MQAIRIEITQRLIDMARPGHTTCPICQAFFEYSPQVGGLLIGAAGYAIPNSPQSFRFLTSFDEGTAKPEVLYVMACKDALDYFRENGNEYVSVVDLKGIRALTLFLGNWICPDRWEYVSRNTQLLAA